MTSLLYTQPTLAHTGLLTQDTVRAKQRHIRSDYGKRSITGAQATAQQRKSTAAAQAHISHAVSTVHE
jgi:hypothetical protein